MIVYEFPYNEHMRMTLRLENLMKRCLRFLERHSAEDHQAALAVIFEITDVVTRIEFKRDILQDLERARIHFSRMTDSPEIEPETLSNLLNRISLTYSMLQAATGAVGGHIRNNEWLAAIKKRYALPGGICEFDLPSYHFWANQSPERRHADLSKWLAPFLEFYEAISLMLHLTREAAARQICVAEKGLYQETNGAYKKAQMLRIHVDKEIEAVPEVMATKHMLQVRFRYPDFGDGTAEKTGQTAESIVFEIDVCTL